MSSISGVGVGSGAPIGEPEGPEQAAPAPEGAEAPEAVATRTPTSTPLPSLDSEMLRLSLHPRSAAAPEPFVGPESFAGRMERLTTERKDLGWNDFPAASRDGRREDWNKAMLKLANTDVNAAEKAEREIGKLVERGLKDAIEMGGGGGELTDAQLDQISKALAKEIAGLEVGGVSIEALGQGADLLVADVGKALAGRLMFKRTEGEMQAEARRAGGMFPGEAVDVQDRIGKPLAAKVAAHERAVESKLETKTYFKANVKIDAKKLFGALDEVVKEVSVDTGFKFEKGDFRAKIGAELEIDNPFSSGKAEATVRGYAETRYKGFSAGIEGRATIENLYDDPDFGRTADVNMYMRYRDDKVSAHLTGRTSIPLHGNREDFNWGAEAGVGYNLSDRARLSAGFGVDGGHDREPAYKATVGFTLKF